MRDNRVLIDGRALPLKALAADLSWVPERHKMGNTVFDEDGHWAAFTPGITETFPPFIWRATNISCSATTGTIAWIAAPGVR